MEEPYHAEEAAHPVPLLPDFLPLSALPPGVRRRAPDAARVMDFGAPTLIAGEPIVWSGTWEVTEANLANGEIRFAIVYKDYDESGDLVNRTQVYAIVLHGQDEQMAEAPQGMILSTVALRLVPALQLLQ